jgi:hypothetical protein
MSIAISGATFWILSEPPVLEPSCGASSTSDRRSATARLQSAFGSSPRTQTPRPQSASGSSPRTQTPRPKSPSPSELPPPTDDEGLWENDITEPPDEQASGGTRAAVAGVARGVALLVLMIAGLAFAARILKRGKQNAGP